MKLTVKNFGPIGEAKDIRISPMTLFVGPSNTGKSYLAVLLYAIVQVFTGYRLFYFLRPPREKSDLRRKFKESMSLPDARRAKHLAEVLFPLWAQSIATEWKRKTEHCLGEAYDLLFQNKEMSVVLSLEDDDIHLDLTAPENSRISPSRLRAIGSGLHLLVIRKSEAEENEEFQIEMILHRFHFALLENLSITESHYLPAIRGGLMQMRHALADTTIERASSPKEYSLPYTGVIGDFVRKLLDIPVKRRRAPLSSKKQRDNKDIVRIGKEMEADIMRGEIEVLASETGYPEFRYQIPRNKGRKVGTLSLQNTSAMVSELAPVSVFIRYHLEENHLFIVEEPEANLHPAAQRDIADILVQLANEGVLVLATTHSDIVLEQISNAVHRAKLLANEKSRPKMNGVSLDASRAATYSFVPQDGKTTVKKLEFARTSGFITQDHLDASRALYNETISLLDGTR